MIARSFVDWVRETSIEAFNAIRASGELGQMQLRVLFLVSRFPDSTARELTRHLVDLYGPPEDSNRVRPRLAELLREGHIEESGSRVCSVSGLRAATWRMKFHNEQKELF